MYCFICEIFYSVLDGSLSDTALSHIHGLEVPQNKEINHKENIRDWDRGRNNQFIGLNKKSNSTSQLSATGNHEYIYQQSNEPCFKKTFFFIWNFNQPYCALIWLCLFTA